jgi:hypothetical protein
MIDVKCMDYIITTIKKSITNDKGEEISQHYVIIPSIKSILEFNNDTIVNVYTTDRIILNLDNLPNNYICRRFTSYLKALQEEMKFYKNYGSFAEINFKEIHLRYRKAIENTISKLFVVVKYQYNKNNITGAYSILNKMLDLIKNHKIYEDKLKLLYLIKAIIESTLSDFDKMIESLKLTKDNNLHCIVNIIEHDAFKKHLHTKEVQEIINEIIQKHPEHNLEHKEEYEAILKSFEEEESSKKRNSNKRTKAVTFDNNVTKKAKK